MFIISIQKPVREGETIHWNTQKLNLKLLGFQLLYLIWFNIKLALVFIICSNRFLSKLLICYLKNKQACHPADTFVDCKYFWYILQSCPTLCDPMDCSLSGSSVHGIFQARVLEWIAISFSRGSSRPRNRTWVSHTASRHFTVWATRKIEILLLTSLNALFLTVLV